MRLAEKTILGILWLCALAPFLSAQPSSAPPLSQVRIAFLTDGSWDRAETIGGEFRSAISRLLEGKYEVRYVADLKADFTPQGVGRQLEVLLADPQVDLIVAAGPLSSLLAARHGNLGKPVVATFAINTELLGIPSEVIELQEGAAARREVVSGVENLTYIDFPDTLRDDLEVFQELVPFEKITFVVNQVIFRALPLLHQNLSQAAAEKGLQYDVLEVSDSLVEAIRTAPPIEAAYVAPLLQLDLQKLRQGIEEFNARKIPTFSLWGRSEVELGMLASLSLDADVPKLSRRLALTVLRILQGEAPSRLPVTFRRRQRLSINMSTARAIGVSPSFQMLTEAELLQDVRQSAARRLDLPTAVREGIARNLDLASQDRSLSAGLQDVALARSLRLPSLEVSSLSTFIDDDRADASFGASGQANIQNSLSLSQVLYSDSVLARQEIAESLQRSREEEREQLRLDVAADTARAYLNILISKTVEGIRRSNLELTRSNLELSRTRQRLGFSGVSDVTRWESEIANDRRDMIEASARRNQAEIALNRLLNRPLEEPFLTAEADLDDAAFLTSDERFLAYIEDPESFKVLRRFLAREGLQHAPELRRLEAAIEAQERSLLAAKRAFWSPDVVLQASLSDTRVSRDAVTIFDLPQNGNVDWTIAVNASLPLFQGGARKAERQQAFEDLRRLEIDRQATAERIEQRVRSAAHEAGFTFASISLAGQAFEAASRNFQLVQDAYSQGVVDITDLLDAQQAVVNADLARANAVYQFLLDWVEAQRAVGSFDFLASPAERNVWFERVDAFYREQGVPLRRR
ncbi:MAG TPA: ABC transporter substrate binding protein [Acidobacteriota bacterium]|nr:ABC transporter substrate binding protein [Acidobacteriota bacterium]